MIQKAKNFVFGIFAVLVLLNILAWIAVFELSQPQFLEVTFFDVGQGDAIFIETPGRHQILIDGGPDSTILEKLGREMPFWDRSIDLVVLTHPERDHVSGLLEVLKRYKIDYILWTGIVRDIVEYEEWIKATEQEVAQIKIAKAGQKIIFPTRTGLVDNVTGSDPVILAVLFPFEDLEGQEYKNSNNTSIISRLVFDQTSFLFTGDAYKSVERKLVKGEAKLESYVLKVGHHGSKTSSAKEFIKAVSPQITVISVGKDNRYSHPHQETLENLAEITILRTDLDGDIKITSNGEMFKVEH